MKIIFMGTPDFAVPSLKALHGGRHEVCLVVTQPDRPKGRGRQSAAPAVKRAAQDLGLPVVQPEKLRTREFHDLIAGQQADILVVVAYRILPATLFPLTKHGAVNLHGSLLPKYRGAAPIQWAVANGDTVTGVTIFQLDARVDTGRILSQQEVPIGPEETSGELFVRLCDVGRDLLVETLDALEDGRIEPQAQDDSQATPAPKLKKEDGRLDWSRPARELHDRIRAFNPYPVCYTQFAQVPEKSSPEASPESRILRIHRARRAEGPNPGPGALVVREGLPFVGCGDGLLELSSVQYEGKPPVSGRDFVNGLRAREGIRFQ